MEEKMPAKNKLERAHQEYIEEKARKSKHLTVDNLYKVLNIKGIENLDELPMGDCDVSASDLVKWAFDKIKSLTESNERLDKENDRMANALDYLLESGSVSDQDGVKKARWGLGLEVEDEEAVAALKPRYSN